MPVLFIVFNRPDATLKVFNAIREARPPKLFIAADGPRKNRPDDIKNCAEVRAIVGKVDWPCDVRTLFQNENIGCKMGESTAFNWFFEHVEMGIMLEDDCLPDSTFFRYCEELLEKYKDEERVMHIGGTNFQNGIKRGEGSYYFSIIPHAWGWASWRRAWKHYDLSMHDLPDYMERDGIGEISTDRRFRRFWMETFIGMYNQTLDTWDYPWVYAIFKRKGLCITPNKNLIVNIGFDERGTHIKGPDERIGTMSSESMDFPLIHPANMEPDSKADGYTFNHILWRETFKDKMRRYAARLIPNKFKTRLKSSLRKT